MEQKTKRLLFNLAYWIMIVAVITACFYTIKFMKSEGRECVANPNKYYADKMGIPYIEMDDYVINNDNTINGKFVINMTSLNNG